MRKIKILEGSNFYGILLLQKWHITPTKPLWEIKLSFIFSLLPNAMLELTLTGTFIKYLELHLNKD